MSSYRLGKWFTCLGWRLRVKSRHRAIELSVRAVRVAPVAFVSLFVASLWLDVAGAAAQSTESAPLALTISGGGAKGAYMAGHLFYMGHASRAAGRPLQPRVFTGASAGAINAFLTVLTACSAAEPDPHRSLYWEAWIPVGINELFDADGIESTSMLTTRASAPLVERVQTLWEAGLPEDCDVYLGATMTRAIPRSVVLAPGLPGLPRSLENVLVRITGRGDGVAPSVQNVFDSSSPASQFLLPLDGPDVDPFSALMDVIFASAAVPFAFAPVYVAHCLSDPDLPSPAPCTPTNAQSAAFFDGGIFDNQPLGLAVRSMRELSRADGVATAVLESANFYFLDPKALAYPAMSESQDDGEATGAIGIAKLLLGMVDSGESSELVSVFEQEPILRTRLLVGRTFFPQISNVFTGLLERSFREFDFYLGMYNAARSVREHPLGRDIPDVEMELLRDANDELVNAWRPFTCLRAILDGVGDVQACEGEDLLDFRILLQLSVDRMADQCRRVANMGGHVTAVEHRRCNAAMTGGPRTIVPGVSTISDAERRREDDEDPLDYQLRLLGLYQFHFRDLGLRREDARYARDQLIRLAHAMVHGYARAQPGNRTALAVLGRIGIDISLGYVPPRHSIHASLGLGGEIGYSATVNGFSLQWLRLSVALGFDGLSTIFSSADTYFAFVPKAGLEFEVLGRPLAQTRVGIRAGYQFSTTDSFGGGECDLSNEALRPCTRFVTELYTSVSLLGFVRFQLAGLFKPKLRGNQQNLFSLRPTIGIQLNSPF